jgi:uncharacterized protein (TIRG00374 family)
VKWRILRLSVALLAIYLLFHIASPGAVLAALSEAEPGWIGLTAALSALATLAGTASFAAILSARGVRIGMIKVLLTDLAGHFYALTLPAGIATGGAIRVVRLADACTPVAMLIGAILASRLLDITVCTLLALLSLPFITSYLGEATWMCASLASGLALLTLGAYAAAQSRILRLWIARMILPRLPMPVPWRRRVRRTLRRLGGSQAKLGLAGQIVPFGCVVLRHLLGGAAVLAAAHAFGTDLPFAATLWVRALATMAVLLPFSVAGIGIYEASFVFLITQFGISPADALAMSLIILAYQLMLASCGGIIELAGSLRRLRPQRAGEASTLSG